MSDHANDLDELLDSALDDFQNLNIAAPAKRGEHVAAEKKEAAAAALPEVKGLGLGLPALNSSKKGKQKISKGSHVSEALDKLKEQTQETVRGLESVTVGKDGGDNLGKDAMVEDWVKQFEELAGSQDMESIVETMMQQLLSKEILYEPMKEISERYPKWLEEHGAGLSQLDHDRFSHQHGLIKDLIAVYENDSANFTKIVEIMQKMQECGQPPNDIVQELAPDFDLANLGQLSPDERSNCSIM